MRIFFQYILPIVAPLAIYVAWLVLQGKGKKLPHWNEGPWFWLIVAGFVLGGASLITFGVSGLEGKEGVYVPPRFEEGKILPPERR